MIRNSKKIQHSILPVLEEYKKVLIDLYGITLKKIILYGSYTRGDQNDDSDIDLAIILDGDIDTPREIDRINEKTYEIDINHEKVIIFLPISASDFNSENISLFNSIKCEGISV